MTSNGEVRDSVRLFAGVMEEMLQKNDHKGGWETMTVDSLMGRLIEECCELEDAIDNGEAMENVAHEAADVANFCMMVAENYAREKFRHENGIRSEN